MGFVEEWKTRLQALQEIQRGAETLSRWKEVLALQQAILTWEGYETYVRSVTLEHYWMRCVS